MLVQLADLQDQEVGDGTTSVVIIAAELLKVCELLFASTLEWTRFDSLICPSYSDYERLSSCSKGEYSLHSRAPFNFK